MSDLAEVLKQLRERIDRYRERLRGEENTKAILIDPALRTLGWDLENIDEVQREFRLKSAAKPVDYALLVSKAIRVFIEAKALGENLDDPRWANQIMGYASVAGAKWIILTDGNEYRIYNAHAEVPVEEKLFRTIRISNEDSQVEQSLSLLSKESMMGNRVETLWKAELADRQVRTAIEELFGPTPSPSLARLIKKRWPGLSSEALQASLNRVSVRLDFRVEPSPPPPGGGRKESLAKTSSRRKRKQPPRDVSLKDLIADRLLTPPLELKKTYKGRELSARVESDGRVTCLGKTYDSLSTSAAMARFSIIGAPHGRKYPQTNGWVFWRFVDENGRVKPIDVLRQRYVAARP
jgi:Restriction Enzyme Adenine Methylase Associated/Type I restriction enzyme R protein N terminus (HSDR_N)